MQSLCDYLANSSCVMSPISMATNIYDQYICYLCGVLDRHAPLICQRVQKKSGNNLSTCGIKFIYLFGVLHRFQHCIGHIMMGRWEGRGNQYIQLVKVLY